MQFSVTPNGVRMDYQHRPKSNAERQRDFRARNPGYYQRLHAKRKAVIREMAAEREFVSVFVAQLSKAPLMLPAPVEAIVIPGMNAIPTNREEMRERVAV